MKSFRFRTRWIIEIIIIMAIIGYKIHAAPPSSITVIDVAEGRSHINIGTCTYIIDRDCPDDDIKFYLFTRANPDDRQLLHIDNSWESSNLSSSHFDPTYPVKVVIHGYNSDMFLHPLIEMKTEYLQRGNYNLFYVDWSILAPGPCYPSAVHNTRHVGKCIGQLIDRIIDGGTSNIHVIGFSLGAQVTNYVANAVRPFKLPRITGLDPAMPLFITADAENKLDPSDADFVDVIHTNALVQGKIERCGHVDFYMNGGIIQPGCWKNGENPFACSHHRAPDYFSESIRSLHGFWGYTCSSYIYYLLGFCPPNSNQALAGEDSSPNVQGLFLISTHSSDPFAKGRWTELGMGQVDKNPLRAPQHLRNRDPLQKELDHWGKLEGDFNNNKNIGSQFLLESHADIDDWPYFDHPGTNQLTTEFIERILIKEEQLINSKSKNITRPVKKRLRKRPSRRRTTTTPNPETSSSRTQFFEESKRNRTSGIRNPENFKLPEIVLNR